MRQHIWAIAFSVCLVGFTAYASLDTFAFADVYKEGATEMNTSMFDGVSSSTSAAASASAAVSSSSSAVASASPSVSGDVAPSASAGSESSRHGTHMGGSNDKSGKSGKPGKTGKPAESEESAELVNGSDASGGASSSSAARNSTASPASAATLSGQSQEYSDGNVNVSLSEYAVAGTTVHVADVVVSSAEYLKTAFANDAYGKNVTAATSQTAAAHNAILAINGDNYGSRERGYVIRNGVVYRDTPDSSDVLCVRADGSFQVVDPSTVSADELVSDGVWQAFSFGPALVEDGKVSVSQNDEVGKAKASNPRTAIGVVGNNHYVFVVSDGRTGESEGLSLYELAEFMQGQLSVECAYNLDGGGSSTMVFNGEVVNNPTTNGNRIEERKVNDIVYIG